MCWQRWERNTQNVLDVNPNFWGTAPAIKRVIMRNVTELANLQSAIETGDADIVQDLGAEQAKALEGNPDLQIVKANSTQLVYIGMNAKIAAAGQCRCARGDPLRDQLRRDRHHAAGRQRQAGAGDHPRGLSGHTGETPFKQDIAKAKELLAKAGVAEGTEIELTGPARASRRAASNGARWRPRSRAISSRSG